MEIIIGNKLKLVSGGSYQVFIDQDYKHQQGLFLGAIVGTFLAVPGALCGWEEKGLYGACVGGLGLGLMGFTMGYLDSRCYDSQFSDGYLYEFHGPCYTMIG